MPDGESSKMMYRSSGVAATTGAIPNYPTAPVPSQTQQGGIRKTHGRARAQALAHVNDQRGAAQMLPGGIRKGGIHFFRKGAGSARAPLDRGQELLRMAMAQRVRVTLMEARRQEREHALYVLGACRQRDPATLDLQQQDLRLFACLDEADWRRVADGVDMLYLPRGLQALPGWLGAFQGVRTLLVPGYAGAGMNLRNLPDLEKLILMEPRFARADIEVDSHCPLIYLDPRARSKLTLVEVSADGAQSRQVLGEGIYFSGSGLGMHSLNGKASFDNGQRILCRHLAPWWLLRQWTLEHPQARFVFNGADMSQPCRDKRERYRDIASPEQIQQTLPPEFEDYYKQIAYQSSAEKFFVSDGKLGAFARAEFERLLTQWSADPGQAHSSFFAVYTNSHMMGLQLKLKPAKDGLPPKFVMCFYDPNRTLTHARMLSYDLDRVAERFRLGGLADEVANYFLGPERVFLISRWEPQPPPGRTMVWPHLSFLQSGDFASKEVFAFLLHFRLAKLLPEYGDILINRVYAHQSESLPARLTALLDTKLASGTSLMQLSAQHPDDFIELMRFILCCKEAGFLNSGQLREYLTSATPKGEPLMQVFYQSLGDEATLRRFLDLVSGCMASDNGADALSAHDWRRILLGEEVDGTYPLLLNCHRRVRQALECFVQKPLFRS